MQIGAGFREEQISTRFVWVGVLSSASGVSDPKFVGGLQGSPSPPHCPHPDRMGTNLPSSNPLSICIPYGTVLDTHPF
eukprot:1156372-Pelagomonas_calceolata.AAC.10